MSRSFDLVGASASDMAKGLRELGFELASSKSPELIASARILRRSLARTTAVSGGARIASSIRSKRLRAIGGRPAPPGQPPHAQTKQLTKSFMEGPVENGRRVGPIRFTGRLQETGVDATVGTKKTRKSGRGKGQLSGTVQRTIRIPARPFMAKALAAVQDQMIGATVRLGEERALKAAL